MTGFDAEQAAIDNAIEDGRDPYAGEYPPEDYLNEEADRLFRIHLENDHDGGPCTCPVAPPITGEAPF